MLGQVGLRRSHTPLLGKGQASLNILQQMKVGVRVTTEGHQGE